MSRFASAVLAIVVVASMIGCGGGHVSVEGKVTVDGSPLDTGNVSFHPQAEGGEVGYGEIKSDGAYTLMSDGKSGVAPGKYKVVVTAGKPSNPSDPYSVPVPLVDAKFSNLSSTPLEVEVSAGAAAGQYDLKVTK
jgi:hypothetical protein